MTTITAPPNGDAWGRILDTISANVTQVGQDVRDLDAKVDEYVQNAVTKQEFQAYQEIRRATVRWAVTTIVSVMVFLVAAVAVVIQTRPGFVE